MRLGMGQSGGRSAVAEGSMMMEPPKMRSTADIRRGPALDEFELADLVRWHWRGSPGVSVVVENCKVTPDGRARVACVRSNLFNGLPRGAAVRSPEATLVASGYLDPNPFVRDWASAPKGNFSDD